MKTERNSWNYYSDEPMINENRKSNTILKIVAPAVSAFCFYFLYSGRFDEFFYDKTLIIIPALMVLIIIPIMFRVGVQALLPTLNGKMLGTFLGALSVLINGPFFGYWTGVVEERAFAAYGITTTGIVTQAWESDGSRMYYNFKANGITYTSFNVSNIKDNKEGDTILIIYNKNNPEMNKAL